MVIHPIVVEAFSLETTNVNLSGAGEKVLDKMVNSTTKIVGVKMNYHPVGNQCFASLKCSISDI